MDDLQTAIRNVVPENEFERFCLDTWAAGRTPGQQRRRHDARGLFARLIVEFCKIERPQRIDIIVRSPAQTHLQYDIIKKLGELKNKYVRILPTQTDRCVPCTPRIIFVYDSYWTIALDRFHLRDIMTFDVPAVWFDDNIYMHTNHPSPFVAYPLPKYNAFASGFDIWETYLLMWAFVVIERRACADIGRVVIGFLVT